MVPGRQSVALLHSLSGLLSREAAVESWTARAVSFQVFSHHVAWRGDGTQARDARVSPLMLVGHPPTPPLQSRNLSPRPWRDPDAGNLW